MIALPQKSLPILHCYQPNHRTIFFVKKRDAWEKKKKKSLFSLVNEKISRSNKGELKTFPLFPGLKKLGVDELSIELPRSCIYLEKKKERKVRREFFPNYLPRESLNCLWPLKFTKRRVR